MTCYIVLAGDEAWDTVNGVWAAVKEEGLEPKRVYILGEQEKYVNGVRENLKKLLVNYDISAEMETLLIEEDENSLNKLKSALEDDSEKTVLDITGGTKFLSADILIRSGADFDNIYCLVYRDDEHMDKPYPMIENSRLVLKDLRRDSRGEQR